MGAFLAVTWFLMKEFFKGSIIAGIIRIIISHVFRGEITFEGFVRSCLFGGVVLFISSAVWLFLP